jgi:hypothetical protein
VGWDGRRRRAQVGVSEFRSQRERGRILIRLALADSRLLSSPFLFHSSTWPSSEPIRSQGEFALPRAFIASGCARALLLFPHPHGSLRLKGIHFPISRKPSKFSTALLNSAFIIRRSHAPPPTRPRQVSIAAVSWFPGSPWWSIPTDGS